jgi:glyoxylase-like metal-dependent hydrolase (beta-lactamase superfamily II)
VVRCIDLRWQGVPGVIGCWQLGSAIIDPGPRSCLDVLVEQVAGTPELILLTHIHLDHAGAAGTLARRFPRARIVVHQSAVRHLEDPSRLLASARRVHGARMRELWGEVEPVPGDRIVAVEGGERIAGFEILPTPGHAKHHVAFLHPIAGVAFAGDVAGVRPQGAAGAFPPTLPPEVDVEAWLQSIATLAERRPAQLSLAHFGSHSDVSEHLADLSDRLTRWSDLARELDAEEFERRVRDEVRSTGDARTAAAVGRALGPSVCWHGLRRYWDERAEART